MSFPRGDQSLQIQLGFDDDLRISPTAGALTFTYTGKGGIPIPRLTLLYVLYILLGLGVIYLLVRLFLFMRKRIAEAPAAGMARRETREEPVAARRRPSPGPCGRRTRQTGPAPPPLPSRAGSRRAVGSRADPGPRAHVPLISVDGGSTRRLSLSFPRRGPVRRSPAFEDPSPGRRCSSRTFHRSSK